MALLAESLVEEWLNRNGFFTIRGVRQGVGEMDLVAVRPYPGGVVIGWHVEVQASFRPMGYIAKLTREMLKELGGSPTSVRTRTPEQVENCARAWVANKFHARDKVLLRERLWPGITWSFHLVHAKVKESRELEVFAAEGVICHPLGELLSALSQRSFGSFTGSSGGDLAEIVSYYKSYELRRDGEP
jgi:hypothetical protein